MTTDLYDIIEWEKCCLVLYYYDQTNNIAVHSIKPIISVIPPNPKSPAFYGVHASLFGIALPNHVTHWSICLMDELRNEILFEGLVPKQNHTHAISISDTKEIVLQRFIKYMKFTVGTKYSQRTKNQRNSKHTLVSF